MTNYLRSDGGIAASSRQARRNFARRLAYREAFYWMVRAWRERLLHMLLIVWYLIFQSGGGS